MKGERPTELGRTAKTCAAKSCLLDEMVVMLLSIAGKTQCRGNKEVDTTSYFCCDNWVGWACLCRCLTNSGCMHDKLHLLLRESRANAIRWRARPSRELRARLSGDRWRMRGRKLNPARRSVCAGAVRVSGNATRAFQIDIAVVGDANPSPAKELSYPLAAGSPACRCRSRAATETIMQTVAGRAPPRCRAPSAWPRRCRGASGPCRNWSWRQCFPSARIS